jgi:predicted nucleic acid-binding protein
METMGDSAFVDTNVLLRAQYSSFAQHVACRTLIEHQWQNDVELWISRQVIREYLVQVTHPRTFQVPPAMSQIEMRIQDMLTLFRVADERDVVTSHLLHLMKEYSISGKQMHDANVVATMLAYDIDTLLTLNEADFKRYSDKIDVVTP